jgi:hypothetical protein
VAGEREVYCGACGRLLPGRTADQSDAAPPGWLVAPTARDQAGPWFEPMPNVPVPAAPEPSTARASAGVPAYRIVERPVAERPRAAAPPPPLPMPGAESIAAGGGAAASALPSRAPALRVLLVPLLVVALGSSLGAVVLLVLHVLRDR